MSEHQNTFIPNNPVTLAERYLQDICNKTFLSLWSYPGLYKGPGDELSDLLVIFDNDIIIFSDKYCRFPNTSNLQKDWERWFKRAVYKSAIQAWGAERWIRKFPNRIYADNKAKKRFPFAIPDLTKARFHLIVVAHDGSRRCKEVLGGSGSLMINSYIKGFTQHTTPFYIGDVDENKSFIHVLDDTTLNILLSKLDTISDFISYLIKKEQLLRSEKTIVAAGEEELLAIYLKKLNKEGAHDFIFPGNNKYNVISVDVGFWADFIKSKEYLLQKQADKISYLWDSIIEKFSHHAMTGTQYKTLSLGLQSSEKVMRLMAKESRTQRRMLSKLLMDLIEKTPKTEQAVKYVTANNEKGTTYVFFLYPQKSGISEEEYRTERINLLEAYCYTAKKRIPSAKNIIGIATQSGLENDVRSEDALYLDGNQWTDEHQKIADALFDEGKLPSKVPMNFYHENEYPENISLDPNAFTVKLSNKDRNKPCPCGSGKKYKKCHGK
jgi:hypothetical protein